MKMNVLIVSRERPGDEIFGLGRAIRSIQDEMIALGHSVTILDATSWSDKDFETDARLQRWICWLSRLFGMSTTSVPALSERIVQVLRAKHLLRSNKKITHVWLQDSLLAVAYSWLVPAATKVKCVVSVHGLGSGAQSGNLDGLGLDARWMRIILFLERRALLRANLVILPSKAARTHLVRDLGLASISSHWHVLRHGRPTFSLPTRNIARQKLCIPDDQILVLAIGRVAPVKRYDIILEAVALLQKNHSNLQLCILGGQATNDLKPLIHNLKPEPSFVSSGDVPTFLAAADLYVSACESESYGLANVEALYAGLPCVIAAGGAAPEIIEKGAWLCYPNPQAINEAFNLLISNSALASRMGELAFARYNELPTWQEVTKEQIRLMSNI